MNNGKTRFADDETLAYIKELEKKLSDATKALEEIAMDFGTDYCSGDSMIAHRALAKLRSEEC